MVHNTWDPGWLEAHSQSRVREVRPQPNFGCERRKITGTFCCFFCNNFIYVFTKKYIVA